MLGSLPLLSFRIRPVEPSDNITRKFAFKVSAAVKRICVCLFVFVFVTLTETGERTWVWSVRTWHSVHGKQTRSMQWMWLQWKHAASQMTAYLTEHVARGIAIQRRAVKKSLVHMSGRHLWSTAGSSDRSLAMSWRQWRLLVTPSSPRRFVLPLRCVSWTALKSTHHKVTDNCDLNGELTSYPVDFIRIYIYVRIC